MIRIKVAFFAVLALALAACAEGGAGNKQTIGTLLGGAAGGLLGAQVGNGAGQLAATAGGALVGAWLGNEIGKSLDKADRAAMNTAQDDAYQAPIGQKIAWNNPESGNYGTVTPVRDGTDQQTGEYCREFQHDVTIGGETEQAYGVACRQPDGTWKIVQ